MSADLKVAKGHASKIYVVGKLVNSTLP